MKVTYLTKEYPPCIYGGAGIHIKNLTEKMKNFCSVEVRTFCKDSTGNGVDVFNSKRWEDIDVVSDKKFLKVLDVLSQDISFLFREIDGDIIHSHTWYTNVAGVWGKILYGKPLVITLHSIEPLRVWKSEQLGRGYELSKWIERRAVMESDGIIAVSKGMREDILSVYDIPPEKVEVIHNGIDINVFRPTFSEDVLRQYRIKGELPYILFVGRISRQKGLDILLDVFETLQDKLQLVLCASSPDTLELKEVIEERVKSLENVIWIDKMVEISELVVLYSHALIFCCPSVYEPFGIINLEAMATETPVVASDVGGIKEVVEDGKDGFLIHMEVSKDEKYGFRILNRDEFVENFRERILFLMKNRDILVKMGKRGRVKVKEKFSWDKIALDTFNFYKKILKI